MTAVIHPDINARRADYRAMKIDHNHSLVTKIFPTLQGEGPFAGQFAIFVRLAGCNLGAKKTSCWFCDTDFKLANGSPMPHTEILGRAESLRAGRPRLMVLTGGEPLMQDPHALINIFVGSGWKVQVETNGYFWSEDLQNVHHRVGFSIVLSPKVNHRGVYPIIAGQLLRAAMCVKVLVDDDKASPYYEIPKFAHDFHYATGKPLYLSPINHYLREPGEGEVASFWGIHDLETIEKHGPPLLDLNRCARNHRYAAKLALDHGYRLSIQSHLFAELP
jgi:7-carboxy-7-deazaguanine synthase